MKPIAKESPPKRSTIESQSDSFAIELLFGEKGCGTSVSFISQNAPSPENLSYFA
jgi:hypothetical protein